MKRGLIDRDMAQRLLTKYRVPMTPLSRVDKGRQVTSVLQSELFEER